MDFPSEKEKPIDEYTDLSFLLSKALIKPSAKEVERMAINRNDTVGESIPDVRTQNFLNAHGFTGRMVLQQPRAIPRKIPLQVEITQTQEAVIVGLRNEITLRVTSKDDERRLLKVDQIRIEGYCDETGRKIRSQLKPAKNGVRLIFWPTVISACTFSVRSDGYKQYVFPIEAGGNNPVMSFSEDLEWPIGIAVRKDDGCLYVAYMHHVSKYRSSGEFVHEVLRVKHIFFNDVAVDQKRHKIAVSTSGWRKDGTHKFRFQAIRLYSLNGTLLWSVGKQHPLFGVSIVRLAFDPDGDILVASKDALCTCARSTGVVERRQELHFGTASRVAIMENGQIVVADGNKGHIYVFDRKMNPSNDFHVQLDAGENEIVGLTGLTVDSLGHILVSDCLTSSIHVYSQDGTLIVAIESEWEFVKWPLALAVSRDGHLFVVDHGNGCIKKYRYI